MQPMTSTRAYLESTVMTARPEQLQLMLYEGAIRFAQNLRSSLQAADFEGAYNAYERVSAVLNELHNGLRPSANPELCEKFSTLYDFVQRRLDDASLKRESVFVDDAISKGINEEVKKNAQFKIGCSGFTVTQAYAMTIHKSQGLTLKPLVIDIAKRKGSEPIVALTSYHAHTAAIAPIKNCFFMI